MYNSEFSIDRMKNVGKRSYSASTYYNISAGRPNFAAFLGTQASPVGWVVPQRHLDSVRTTGDEDQLRLRGQCASI